MTTKQRAYLKSLADDLYDLRTGALSHHFCQSSRIIRTVLQYTDLDQFTCIQSLADRLCKAWSHAGFSNLKDRIHGHGKKIVLYKEGKDDKKKIVLP